MTTLYGIKQCDTVRKTMKWLDAEAISYQFHDLRSDGIEASKVQSWLDTIGAEKLINRKSTTWRSLSDAQKQSAEKKESAIELLVNNPTLIKRPVLEHNGKTTVGFKAEEYHTILDTAAA